MKKMLYILGTIIVILLFVIFVLPKILSVTLAYYNSHEVRKASDAKKYTTMFLWEDDYLMAEIMSSKNLNYAKEQVGEVVATIKSNQIETKELKISKIALSDLLKSVGLNEYERISYAGIGESKILENQRTRAFGDLNSAIFFDGETDIVEHIWLSSHNWSEVNKTKILKGLNAIGNEYDMILVDIYPIQNKIVDLKDKTEIQNYLNVYLERFNK